LLPSSIPILRTHSNDLIMPKKEVYYKDYLQLDKILGAQELESEKAGVEAHDEMLFIVIHQAYELWFKQVLYELDSIIALLSKPEINDNDQTLQIVVHRSRRIIEILRLLVDQINVMETMSSLDFLDFRDLLRPASGFQSIQWKELEAKLGLLYENRHGKEYYVSQLCPMDVDHVKDVEKKTNLLDLLNVWLERMPYFEHPEAWADGAKAKPEDHPFWAEYREKYTGGLLDIEQSNADLFDKTVFGKEEDVKRRLSAKACRSALFIYLYRGFPLLHLPYELMVSLVEIDELMASWRMRHVNMVFRMIGARVGTGNSTGHGYLKGAMDKHYIFNELTQLNGLLVPRNDLPELPKELEKLLGFRG
jgi:tryptophan 2,3-dioxygenase